MRQIPRSAIVTAINNTLRRGGIQGPELLASACATAVLDAISILESVENAQAPGSPEDFGSEFNSQAARSPISLPQPELERVPAPRPQLVELPSSVQPEQTVAIRPKRSGKEQVPGEARRWEFGALQVAVMAAPATIEVATGVGSLTMTRAIDADEASGIVKLSFTVPGGSTSPDIPDAVSLGQIMVSHPFSVFSENPLDLRIVMMDLRNRAAGMVRTRSGGPVVSRNPPTDDAAKSHFRSITADMQRAPEDKKNQGNWDEA